MRFARCRPRWFYSIAAAATAVSLLPGIVLGGVELEDISPESSTFWTPQRGFGASGGRVNGLAGVPGSNQVFYAASEWGGLFKTIDGGKKWSLLDDHVPVAVWDVEVDPSNHATVYATSMYDGRVVSQSGIQVSRDEGATWTHPPTATAPPPPGYDCPFRTEPSAFGIAIQPGASSNVFIGTNCGLAVSRDSGNSWTFLDLKKEVNPAATGPANEIWDVVAQQGGIIDACGGDGHFRSEDGGVSWTQNPLPFPPFTTGRCSLAVSPDESYVLFVADDVNDTTFGDFHSVWESDDGGLSWTLLGKPYDPAKAPKRIPMVVTNDRLDSGGDNRFDLWYGEQDLWRAECVTPTPAQPGGALRCTPAATWTLIGKVVPGPGPRIEEVGAHGDAGDLQFDPTVSIDACPLMFSSDGGVFLNIKTGADCHDMEFAQPVRSPKGLWLWGMAGANQSGDTVDLYFGTQDVGIWETTDAHLNPPLWDDGLPSDSFTVTADVDRVVWYGDVLQVQDPGLVLGGPVDTPNGDPLTRFLFIGSIDRYESKEYVAVTAGATPGVFVTEDITASPVAWTQLDAAGTPGGLCGVRAADDPFNPGEDVFYLRAGVNCNRNFNDLTGDGLYKYQTANPAAGWQRIDTNGMTGGIGVFGVDPTDANRLYASNLQPAPRMVFSTDGGQIWQPDPELDDMMTGVGLDPLDRTAAVFKYANERGATTDWGFSATYTGYPQPSLVAFDPYDPSIIVAGGRDSGVFLSTDGGANWGRLTDPFDPGSSDIPHIPRPWFAHFHHDAAGTVSIYIGTQGRGVWRLTIRPPTASAGGPYATPEGTDIVLDASGSSDPDGEPLLYEWDLDDDKEYDDYTGAHPVFSDVGQDGVHTVSVKVSAGGVFSIASTHVTVTNVAPTTVLTTDAPQNENAVVTVSGVVSDPGWEDPLSATIDWGDGSPPQPVVGVVENVRPDATLSFTATHVYGDNGSFVATVLASDDDTTTAAAIPLAIDNVDPTAAIDSAGTVMVNGLPTFVAHAGQPLDFHGRSIDPGSDDLTLSWDWDDGPPAPDVLRIDLVNPPDPDPTPSPSIQPRDLTDVRTHAFEQACRYEIVFGSDDDDGGSAFAVAQVIISGNADLTRSAGYWHKQYAGRGSVGFDATTLQCYLDIAGYMSLVFHEVMDASSVAGAAAILKPGGGVTTVEAFDRQLLGAWLNFANGAVDLGELVDTDGDKVLDTTFLDAVTNAESVRLDPAATDEELEQQKDILQRINERDKDK